MRATDLCDFQGPTIHRSEMSLSFHIKQRSSFLGRGDGTFFLQLQHMAINAEYCSTVFFWIA